MLKLLMCFTVFVYMAEVESVDYCQLSCRNKNNIQNTACIRKNVNCGAGPSCGKNFKVIKFSQNQINYIIDLHNQLRNKVATGNEKRGGGQPSAANMNALSFDKDLQYVAQCWTNNCVFNHDDCRRTEKYEYVGQNLAIYQTTAASGVNITERIREMVYDWYNEVTDYDKSSINSFYPRLGPVTGHYTQLVWAETQQLGCAMTYYTENRWHTYFFGCNYGPSGNFIGQPVYKIGTAASMCSNGNKDTKYSGLCQT